MFSVVPLGGATLFSETGGRRAALFSGDPLAYMIAVAGKINEVTIKSTQQIGFWIHCSLLSYLNIYAYPLSEIFTFRL